MHLKLRKNLQINPFSCMKYATITHHCLRYSATPEERPSGLGAKKPHWARPPASAPPDARDDVSWYQPARTGLCRRHGARQSDAVLKANNSPSGVPVRDSPTGHRPGRIGSRLAPPPPGRSDRTTPKRFTPRSDNPKIAVATAGWPVTVAAPVRGGAAGRRASA